MRLPELIKSLLQNALHRLFCLLPIRREVVFIESFIGLSYACNPKYLYEEMLKQKLPYKYVWSFQDEGTRVPGNAKVIRRFSIPYYYYLATAKYLINNAEFAQNLPVRSRQVYLNTQHGTPLKKMGRHQPDDKPNRKPKTGRWTYLLTQNAYSSDIFRDAYLYDGEVLEYGHPRNDLFFTRNGASDRLAIKKRLGLPLDRRIVLYAPTWRKGESDLHINIENFSAALGQNCALILRLHHLVSNSLDADQSQPGFLFNFSSSAYDIQELFLVADLLVTDYSSIIFDFANLDKPMVFYTYDIENYKGVERGFYLDFEAIAPGALVNNEADLLQLLTTQAFTEQYNLKYQALYQSFKDRFCSLDDGGCSARVIDTVFQKGIAPLHEQG